ncbi:MAG: hypothetical protein WBQ03_07345 [Candidatus Sulfotelmatobacter sp.]
MATFCVKCGAPLGSGPFCVKCGADMRNVAAPPQPRSPSPVAQTPQPAAAPTSTGPAPAKQGMSALAKLGIAAVVIIFVGGAVGIVGAYYVAHRVSEKFHEVSDGILGSSSDSSRSDSGGSASKTGSIGDVCRLLSKEDVGRAVGVVIARAQPGDNSCSYIAKGDKADMLAKHTTAMMAARGADKQTQQTIQKFAGGMFKTFQSEQPVSEQDTSGEIPVFSFSVDQNGVEEQMRLNEKILGVIGDQERLPGLGDQAFVSADGMIMMRKGKNFVRIMFIACPCNTEAVKPLAKEIADAL